jgi:hypothetical protein
MKHKDQIEKPSDNEKDVATETKSTCLDEFMMAQDEFDRGEIKNSPTMKKISGFDNYPAAFAVIGHVIAMTNQKIESEEDRNLVRREVNTKLEMMASLGPKDGFEGMLIAQMMMVFQKSVDLLYKSNGSESFEFSNSMLNQSIKLMKLYNQQLESLDKHRRGGKQKMTVEHINVSDGGQAIIGDVHQGGDEH